MKASQVMHGCAHIHVHFANELLGETIISYRTYTAKDKNKVIKRIHPDINQQKISLPVHFLGMRSAIYLPPLFSIAVTQHCHEFTAHL